MFEFDEKMSFVEIQEAIKTHEDAIKVLRAMLPKACQREGHHWSEVKRDDICEDSGDYVEGYECNGEDRGLPGYYRRSPTYSEAYSRTCQRCGLKDRRRAVQTVKLPTFE